MKAFCRLFLPLIIGLFLFVTHETDCKSVILANYYNVVLYYPSEYGGNDDIRIVFDLRNISTSVFKYTPIIVDVSYDSAQNLAYCYLESAIKSYIVLLKWFGGKWCYQIMFEFDSSTYSNFMYHSVVALDNFVYWTSDRFIMSGRIPGYEQRRLMQPGWERVYRMTIDRPNRNLYVASFDFGENALYSCSILQYSCVRLTAVNFAISSLYYNSIKNELYVSSVQTPYLFRYQADHKGVTPLTNIKATVSDLTMMDDGALVFTNRESLYVCSNLNTTNCIRAARPRLVDPYTLQYVFTFDHVSDFDSYPYPYSDFHDVLWRDKQYLFHLHILGMDFVENDYAFLPEMDLNSRFLHVETCSNIFYDSNQRILVPALIAGGAVLAVVLIALAVCLCRSKNCRERCGCRRRTTNVDTDKKDIDRGQLSSQFRGNSPNMYNLKDTPKNNDKKRAKRMQFENTSFVPSLDDIYEYQIAKQSSPYPYSNMEANPYTKMPPANRSHSSGFYNISRRDMVANHTPSTTDPSESDYSSTYYHHNLTAPRPDNKMRSSPASKSFLNGLRFTSNTKPMSINFKKPMSLTSSFNSSEKYFYREPKDDERQRYVSSCHIPLYGSSNRSNYISIRKAIPDSSTDRSNTNTPTISMALV